MFAQQKEVEIVMVTGASKPVQRFDEEKRKWVWTSQHYKAGQHYTVTLDDEIKGWSRSTTRPGRSMVA